MSIIKQIILDLTRQKIYSDEGKHVGPRKGRFDYLDEIEKKFKQVGHIKKNAEGYRVIGKHMPDAAYIHKNYIPESEKERVEAYRKHIPEGFDATILKFSKDGSISFINSPDFDTADEPLTGEGYKVSPDGVVSISKMKSDPQIYHHKWQMVGNEYQGFDVQKSKERSKFWTEHPQFLEQVKEDPRLKNKIGTKSKWEEVNKKMQPLVDPNYHPERTSINSKRPSAGITKAVKWGLIPDNALVLDYGGGKFDAGKNHIESSVPGSRVLIYDPHSRDSDHNLQVMSVLNKEEADVVMNHNVLNVIPTSQERGEVIQAAYSHLKSGGSLHITVYEGDPKERGVPRRVEDKKTGAWNWQENRATADYIPEIQHAIPSAQLIQKKDGLLVFRKP